MNKDVPVAADLYWTNKLKLENVPTGTVISPRADTLETDSVPRLFTVFDRYFTMPVQAQDLENPDFPDQVVIVVLFAGGVPVPRGSEPSNQICRPAIYDGRRGPVPGK
jgi:hypothetical protein